MVLPTITSAGSILAASTSISITDFKLAAPGIVYGIVELLKISIKGKNKIHKNKTN